MQQVIIKIFFFLLTVSITTACSNSKHLAGSDRLFKGSIVHIKDHEAGKKERKMLENDLSGLVRPKTNSKTLGMRLKLTMYNLAGDTKKKKGLRQWFRNKAGEPPVLIKSVALNTNKELMVNFLENRGYFNAKVTTKFDSGRNKKSSAVFTVITGKQYKIKEVLFSRHTIF